MRLRASPRVDGTAGEPQFALSRLQHAGPVMSAYDPSNVFAKILRGELPSHTVYEDADTIAIMDIMPRADGHVLVVPKAACRNVFDAPPEALKSVALSVQTLARAVKSAFNADGVTIQQFNEAAGGQVVFHLHVHVMPRFDGVALRPHTGAMEKPDVLAAHAEKIRAALKNL
ncbi:histidine triad (HIT) family protein [Bosea psychrotolerans]|uniref:Histidine triad (HIT) family protein n=2 Tax=Bosea psychrotolerans TaxID=1871628 RepID=A0A2S4ML61_9HYPH|nr:histidine triad (HIT) family protein [Bosea psychrotolerans]